MSWAVALNLTTSLLSAFLGIVVWLRSKKNSANQFALLALVTSIWIGTNVLYLVTKDLTWLRAAYGTGILLPIAAIYWADVFGGKEYGLLVKNSIRRIISAVFLLIIGPLFFYLCIFTNKIVLGLGDSGSIQQGSLFMFYSIALFMLMLFSVVRLYLRSKALSGSQQDQAKIVFLGFLSFGLVATTIDVILPLVGYPEYALLGLDSTSAVFLVIAAAYAITRHGLFDLKIILTEMTAGGLVLINFIQLLTSKNSTEAIQNALILGFVSLMAYLLIKSVQNEVTRREEVEKLAKEKTETLTELEERNKNLATLQTISKLVLNEIEMKPMVQKILNEIPKRLEHSAGALLSLVKDGQLQTYAMSETETSAKLQEMIGRGVDQFSYPIKKEFNKIHEALVDKKLLESPHLSEFICPPVTRPVAMTIQKLLGVHSAMAIPLFNGPEPLGVLMLVFKVECERLNKQDMEMVMAVADDVSLAIERAESYQKLKDANAYLSQLDKMKDEFISMASHELNTPLAAVEGYLSMILDEHMGKIDDKAKMYLGRAYDSSKRLAELILDLLNVSRIEQGRVKMKFTEANVFDLAESTVHELQVKVDAKNLTIKLEGAKSDKLKTWCDPDRIREVIVNLVGNAIKYTEKGGITLKVEEDNGKIVVRITDTGRGIAQEDMSKLFQKFSQVKREIDEHQGTGLGLYISKNFVDLHKGRIWVESEVGKGSMFAFEIPVLTEPPKEVAGAILENMAAPKIEAGVKDTPAIIAQSSNGKM